LKCLVEEEEGDIVAVVEVIEAGEDIVVEVIEVGEDIVVVEIVAGMEVVVVAEEEAVVVHPMFESSGMTPTNLRVKSTNIRTETQMLPKGILTLINRSWTLRTNT
jgi:hypothetical protein